MRHHLEIEHRIGIGGKGTGAAIFLALALTIGLAWAVLDYLDGRKKDYQDRIVGALKFLNWTIATSQEIDAELYRPSLKPGSQANRWVLSGVMVMRDHTADQRRGRREKLPYFADLKSVCANHGSPRCWRLSSLVVDGRAVIGSPGRRNWRGILKRSPFCKIGCI